MMKIVDKFCYLFNQIKQIKTLQQQVFDAQSQLKSIVRSLKEISQLIEIHDDLLHELVDTRNNLTKDQFTDTLFQQTDKNKDLKN